MDFIRIEILNPKARKLLKNLAELKLIRISDFSDKKIEFKKLLNKLRLKLMKLHPLKILQKKLKLSEKPDMKKKARAICGFISY